MKKLSLAKKGLSLSQAQSISNLCYQRAKDIEGKLKRVNNAEKTFKLDGEQHTLTIGVPMPENVVMLILEKSQLHATQAFLMENIKGKDALIEQERRKMFEYNVEEPEPVEYLHANKIPLVDESWGWEQLSLSEMNEYVMAEAYAAHIGQFIHKGSLLHNLREELSTIGNIEWIDIKEKTRTPVTVTPHHTPEELLHIHEELAKLHRQYEQKVNYYKAKVKNLVTNENARISEENAREQAIVNEANKKLQLEYKNAYQNWQAEYRKALQEFEKERQLKIGEIASLRIDIAKEFQPVIDRFLAQLSEKEE